MSVRKDSDDLKADKDCKGQGVLYNQVEEDKIHCKHRKILAENHRKVVSLQGLLHGDQYNRLGQ